MLFLRIKFSSVCNKLRSNGSFYLSNRKFSFLACRNFRLNNCNYGDIALGFRARTTVVPSASLHQQLVDEISFDDVRLKKHLEVVLQEFNLAKDRFENGRDHEKGKWKHTFYRLQPVVLQIQEAERIEAEMKDLDALASELERQDEKDLLQIAREDRKAAETNLAICKGNILELVVPAEDVDDGDIVMELSAGVGGQEAMLFVRDLYEMYCNFADFRGWRRETLKHDETDIGGLHEAHISISGFGAYRTLKLESGVHRVQRVPKTERAGRIHTSTATVAVLPLPSEIDIVIQPRDLQLEFKSSSGAGGQNVNKRDTCVRITHLPTGIVAESQMERCQHQNRALALKSLRAKLYQRELESRTLSTEHSRKIQVGTAGRSEKVRTYNFAQQRITDHRLHQSVYDVDVFLQGQEKLNNLTESLQRWWYVQSLHELLRKYN